MNVARMSALTKLNLKSLSGPLDSFAASRGLYSRTLRWIGTPMLAAFQGTQLRH